MCFQSNFIFFSTRSTFKEISLCVWTKPTPDEYSEFLSNPTIHHRVDFMTRLETSFSILEAYTAAQSGTTAHAASPDFDMNKCSCLSVQVSQNSRWLTIWNPDMSRFQIPTASEDRFSVKKLSEKYAQLFTKSTRRGLNNRPLYQTNSFRETSGLAYWHLFWSSEVFKWEN